MIFQELDAGKSVQQQPIKAFRTNSKSPHWLYLMAGTHGDEVEGVYVCEKLFEWLGQTHDVKDLPVVVVPILNPDGYERGTRVNAHCVDLNRNYPASDWNAEYKKEKYHPGDAPLSEPENKFLNKLFQKYPPALIITFHTWKALINYNGNSKDIADFLALYNNYEVVESIGYETPGSLGTFVPEKYQAGVITFECPPLSDELTLQQIWEQNEKGLKALFYSSLLEFKVNELD